MTTALISLGQPHQQKVTALEELFSNFLFSLWLVPDSSSDAFRIRDDAIGLGLLSPGKSNRMLRGHFEALSDLLSNRGWAEGLEARPNCLKATNDKLINRLHISHI